MTAPTSPWRLRARFVAWYAVCAALLLGHAAWFAAMRFAPPAQRPRVVLTGGALLASLVILLAVLLATTPADAIRLPRRRSEILIFGGAIFLHLTAFLLASPFPVARVTTASLAALAVTATLLWLLRQAGKSAWIAALFAWNPIVIYESSVTGRAAASIALLLLALLAVARRNSAQV